MKKTYLIHDIVWMSFAFLVCLGGLKLGFGSFHKPHAGFMPFLSGFVLGLLALVDLISGVVTHWNQEKADKEIWANIHWGKLFLTLALLLLYTVLFKSDDADEDEEVSYEAIPFQRAALWIGFFIILCAAALKHLHQ